jgi:hypothetical protein
VKKARVSSLEWGRVKEKEEEEKEDEEKMAQ